MMSQTLQEARTYEETMEARIAKSERPAFHLSSRTGWMNDPNGFCYYQGEYHMFYQYHPYNSHWGIMHWGHAVSKDLLHWRYLPAALAPDNDYDRNGCFSGSATTLPDGRHILMYTGMRDESQPDGSVKGIQTQCIAIGDGIDYEKYEGNPVLTERDLPDGGSRFDFRDPKIWVEEDGSYRCVVAGCVERNMGEKDGRILLYCSEDGLHWNLVNVLAANNGRFGRMWECPDFFELDGKHVLLISPQDMAPKGFEYHNGNGTLCLIGKFDKETSTFIEEKDQSIDYGIDFYAPQTVLAPDGRRIMIGWMQNWDTCNLHAKEKAWFGQMSLPRELSIKDGRLIQKPIRELEKLRGKRIVYKNISVRNIVKLEHVCGRQVDMEVTIRPGDTESLYRKFAIRFAQDESCYTSVSFRPQESVIKIDRKYSGSRRAIIHQRRSQVRHENGNLKLRIILDRYSAEIFVNDGEHVLSITIDTTLDADGISFLADGAVQMDLEKYDLSDMKRG